jgi:hypothetical protein
VAHQVRSFCQQPGHQRRVGIEILTRADLLAAPVACPVDNLQREAVSQLQLLAPAQLAGQHAAVQQHHPRSPAGAPDEQPCHHRNLTPRGLRDPTVGPAATRGVLNRGLPLMRAFDRRHALAGGRQRDRRPGTSGTFAAFTTRCVTW